MNERFRSDISVEWGQYFSIFSVTRLNTNSEIVCLSYKLFSYSTRVFINEENKKLKEGSVCVWPNREEIRRNKIEFKEQKS
jgi:hypothetical protein